MTTKRPNPCLIIGSSLLLVLVVVVTGCWRGGDAEVESEPPDEVAAATVDTEAHEPIMLPIEERNRGSIPRRDLDDIPFEFSWDLKMPMPVHTSWISPNVPELIFFQLTNGEIHAIHHKTGKTKWVNQVHMPALLLYEPFVNRSVTRGGDEGDERVDRLYIVSDDMLYVVDGEYGQLIYRYHLGRKGRVGFQPSTGPCVQGSAENAQVFLGDWEGRVRTITYNQEKERAFLEWQYNLYATPVARPVGAAGITYFGDQKGVLRAFGRRRRDLWDFDLKGPIAGPPAIRDLNLYAGSDAGILYVLNRLSGVEMSHLPFGDPIKRQPFYFTGEPARMYVWTSGEVPGLHAIYAEPDKVQYTEDERRYPLQVVRLAKEWYVAEVDRLVSSSPRHLYVVNSEDPSMVHALNRKTGRFEWRWEIDADRAGGQGMYGRGGPVDQITTYQDPDDLNRSIFTVDKDGYIVAYRLYGQFD